ncbi:hypothetical protein OH77DRAFT_511044 [Trametes cingulata]|nr:hypothetical protein OH77DRAFT_511044 [Trametes cingulata]
MLLHVASCSSVRWSEVGHRRDCGRARVHGLALECPEAIDTDSYPLLQSDRPSYLSERQPYAGMTLCDVDAHGPRDRPIQAPHPHPHSSTRQPERPNANCAPHYSIHMPVFPLSRGSGRGTRGEVRAAQTVFALVPLPNTIPCIGGGWTLALVGGRRSFLPRAVSGHDDAYRAYPRHI